MVSLEVTVFVSMLPMLCRERIRRVNVVVVGKFGSDQVCWYATYVVYYEDRERENNNTCVWLQYLKEIENTLCEKERKKYMKEGRNE